MAGWVLIVHITLSAHGIACHCTSVVNLCSMLARVRESVRLLKTVPGVLFKPREIRVLDLVEGELVF